MRRSMNSEGHLSNYVFLKDISIPIDRIYVGQFDDFNRLQYVPVVSSVFYQFINDIQFKNSETHSKEILKYRNYREKIYHPRNEANFQYLLESIKTNGYDYENFAVMVIAKFSLLKFKTVFFVVDGTHRVSILASLNYENIHVSLCSYSSSTTFIRFCKRLLYFIVLRFF